MPFATTSTVPALSSNGQDGCALNELTSGPEILEQHICAGGQVKSDRARSSQGEGGLVHDNGTLSCALQANVSLHIQIHQIKTYTQYYKSQKLDRGLPS